MLIYQRLSSQLAQSFYNQDDQFYRSASYHLQKLAYLQLSVISLQAGR